jgi:hypothetical protein
MTPGNPRKPRKTRVTERLHVTHPHAAGIDIHANVHWVAVPPADAPPPPKDHPANLPAHVRSFGTCTADLICLRFFLATSERCAPAQKEVIMGFSAESPAFQRASWELLR